MIPTLDDAQIEVKEMPSLNYKMDLVDRVYGLTDMLEAMKQVCFKILMTERYQYLIYSWDYGIELDDLFGQPMYYVIPELQRRVEEALLADDRIDSVDNFEFDTSKRHELVCSFTVHTKFGEFDMEKSLNV